MTLRLRKDIDYPIYRPAYWWDMFLSTLFYGWATRPYERIIRIGTADLQSQTHLIYLIIRIFEPDGLRACTSTIEDTQ